MQDVRNELKVKSIRWKVEKRVLERIGHVVRMEDTRQVKAVCLGWLEDLEAHEKAPGKKRKTILYWKQLLKEAGIDWTRIDRLTKDRKEWKALVNKRMKHLQEWGVGRGECGGGLGGGTTTRPAGRRRRNQRRATSTCSSRRAPTRRSSRRSPWLLATLSGDEATLGSEVGSEQSRLARRSVRWTTPKARHAMLATPT